MVQSVYSEVYSILNMLGEEYINKLPSKLLEFIKKEKVNLYNPVYSLDKSIEEQGISEDALAMITFFNLKYWCAPEEKEELLEVLRENEKRYNMLSVVEKTFFLCYSLISEAHHNNYLEFFMININIGNKIRKLRKKKGITQEGLASVLSVSPQAVSKWESGLTYPDMEMIPIIAGYFEVSLDILFDYDIREMKAKI